MNMNIPLKYIKKLISVCVAATIMTSSLPMQNIADGTMFLSEIITAHAEFTEPYTPYQIGEDLKNLSWVSADGSYEISSLERLIAYSWAYAQDPGSHQDDKLILAIVSTGADATASNNPFTGFVSIGDSAATAFRGSIEINTVAMPKLNLDCPLFGYVYDSVKIVAQGTETPWDIVFTRTTDDTGAPLLADYVIHDTREGKSPANGWQINVKPYTDGVNQTNNTNGGIIGVIDNNASVKLSVNDETTADIFTPAGETEKNLGRLCGTMSPSSKLYVSSLTGNTAHSIKASNGHAGGLVGEMGNGAVLRLNCDPSAPNATIRAEGASHYAGGIVGKCDGGYIVGLIPEDGKYTIQNTLYATAGAGGLYGYYKPFSDTPVLETGETAANVDAVSFDLSHYTINCTLNGTGNIGGVFGEYVSGGSSATPIDLTVLSSTVNSVYSSAVVAEDGTVSDSAVNYGGLIGQYSAGDLGDSLTISDATGNTNLIQSTRTGPAAYYGGIIGNVVGASYVKLSDLNVKATTAAKTFGGAVASAVSGFIDVNDIAVTVGTNISETYHGGGIIGDLGNGVLRLTGYTDLTEAKGASEADSGQIVGMRDSALVFADSIINSTTKQKWSLKRCKTTSGLDDIGSWGEVVRFDDENSTPNMSRDSVITIDFDNHTVTLGDADTSGGKIDLKNAVSYAKAALNIQINDSTEETTVGTTTSYTPIARTSGVIRTSASSASATLLGMNVVMSGDVNLAGTGMIGLTRDNGQDLEYSGTTFEGNNHTLTLAIGEPYGTRSDSAVSKTESDCGRIYRHQYNGLFAKTKNAFTISDLTVNGIINAHSASNGTYTGNAVAYSENGIAADNITVNTEIRHYGGGTGSIGGLTGEIKSGDCVVTDSDFNSTITGSATNAIIGGVVGKISSATFNSSLNTVTLTGEVKDTGARSSQAIGGLIGSIVQSSGRSDSNRTLSLEDITLGATGKSFTVYGNVQDTTDNSYSEALSIGGLLGYNWYDTQVTLDGITVANAKVQENKTDGYSNSWHADMAGLVYTATGYWQVKDVDMTGVTVAGTPRSLGMLVNRGWHNPSDGTKASLYLELPAGYNYSLSSGFNVTDTALEVFDELVAYSAEYTQTSGGRKDAEVTENGQGVVSIHTSYVDGSTTKHLVYMDGSHCNTYQNQTSVTKLINPNTRYYYNLDTIRADYNGGAEGNTATDAEKLMLWSLNKYADSNLTKYFSDPYGATIVPSDSGNQFDLEGYSYYPVDVDSSVSIKGNVKFYNKKIEDAEALIVTDDDSFARTTLNKAITVGEGTAATTNYTYTQHYLMHNGLFHDVTVAKVTINGELNLSGTIGMTQEGSGALICGRVSGTDSNHLGEFEVNEANAKIVLDGIAVHNIDSSIDTEYAPLLINKIGSYTKNRIRNISNTDEYSTFNTTTNAITATNRVASSLIGRVGAEYDSTNALISSNVDIEFSGIKLDGRKTANTPNYADMNRAYQTNHSIFTRATLLEEFTVNGGSRGVYDYTQTEDWGIESGNYKRNVTYGEEVGYTTQGEYPNEERWYKNSSILTHYDQVAAPITDPVFTGFLRYVAVGYDRSAFHEQLEVNHGSKSFEGCGTYNDPYVVSEGKNLLDVSKALNGTISDNSFTLCIPNILTDTDSTNDKDAWCENKTAHQKYVWYNSSTYYKVKTRQLYTHEIEVNGVTVSETDNGMIKYYAISYTGEGTEKVYTANAVDAEKTLDTVGYDLTYEGTEDVITIGTETYNKVENKTQEYRSSNSNDTLTASEIQSHLAGAYYILSKNITISNGFEGLSYSTKGFHGVIDGKKYTITDPLGYPLIKDSAGSVVKDLTINVTGAVNVTQVNDSDGNAKTFQLSDANTSYGAVFGKVFGGDNIIDNVDITYDSTASFTIGGSKNKLAPVGGYIGVIVDGGVVFRNMDRYTKNANGQFTTTKKTYGLTNTITGLNGKIGDDNMSWLYVNPIIGRVINGYAFTESKSTDNKYRPFEDGTRIYGDGSVEYWQSNGTVVKKTKAQLDEDDTLDSTMRASAEGVTMRNGNKNYSIADINANDTSTLNNGTLNDAQALFLMSIMVNSGANSEGLGFASGYTYRRAYYTDIGYVPPTNTPAAKPTDYTNYVKNAASGAADNSAASGWIKHHYANKTKFTNTALTFSSSNSPYYLPDGYKGIGNMYTSGDDYRVKVTKITGNGVKISMNSSWNYYFSKTGTDDTVAFDTAYPHFTNSSNAGFGLINIQLGDSNSKKLQNFSLTGNVISKCYDSTSDTGALIPYKGTSNESGGSTTGSADGGIDWSAMVSAGALMGAANAHQYIDGVVLDNIYVYGVKNAGGMIGIVPGASNITIRNTQNSNPNSDEIRVYSGGSAGGMIGKSQKGNIDIDNNSAEFNIKEIVSECTNRKGSDWNYGVGGFIGACRNNGNGAIKIVKVKVGKKDQPAPTNVSCPNANVFAGGLIGIVNKGTMTIEDCEIYNQSVITPYYSGGLIGYIASSEGAGNIRRTTVYAKNYNSTSITNPVISSTNESAGGFIGAIKHEMKNKNVTIQNCSIEGYTITGKTASGGIIGYLGHYPNQGDDKEVIVSLNVSANQSSGQKNEPRSTSAQIPYSVHHNELQ